MENKSYCLKNFRFCNYLFLLLIINLCLSLQVYGKDNENTSFTYFHGDDSISRAINIFADDGLLDVSLSFDLTGFLKKIKGSSPFDGEMTFYQGQNDSVSVEVGVRHRGEYRFQTCSFPPIQVTFKKPVYSDSDTGKIKKVKLVTHCSGGSMSDDYVLREYLVYKLYSVFTDTSFRVRLLRITYNDTGKKRKPVTQFGFFIEPLELLASRTANTVVKAENLNQRHIIPNVMDRVAIFNYMIANWDWSVPGLHNIAVVKSTKTSQSVLGAAIPYDFDLCGVVNADYGTPAPEMGLTSSRDRRFAGICRDRQVIENELMYFLEKKEKLYSVINDFPHLNQRSKKDITSFLDQFFNQMEKKRDLDYLVNSILENCKKL
jgi:hypothetical protein